jgi:Bacterial regulatory helix-turn-helix protein, lysR family
MAARSSEVRRRKRTLAFLLLDLSSAHEGYNWYDTMQGNHFSRLSAFVAVAEHRHFSKAAAHLGISRSRRHA